MSRTLSGAMATQLAAKQLAPIFFFEADFSGGFARAWTGQGSIVWDAKTWLGTGQFLGFSQIEESREIQATQLSVSLSGVDPAMVATAYGDFSQGRPLVAWFGVIDPATMQVVSDPIQIFAGRMDTISDEDTGDTATITVTAESRLADLKRVRARFFTDQDQRRIAGGDRSLRFIPSLQERPVYWGVREGSPQLPTTST